MSTKLPVVREQRAQDATSTAATTAFCEAKVLGPAGTFLYMDGNGKITAANGTLAAPAPNSFSLPAAAISGLEHCPQSTAACREACYVGPLSRAQAELYAKYEHNAAEIRRILADADLANAWVLIMAGWIKANAAGGFRWHVSGDVFSLEYAEFIADVCRESAAVEHWIYTRSFEFLGPLIGAATINGGNLAVNLSCDRDNYVEARRVRTMREYIGEPSKWKASPLLRLCYLTLDGTVPSDLTEDDVIFPDYKLRPKNVATLAESEWWQSLPKSYRGLVCPVDAHGKAENRRCGPCDRCIK